RQGQLPLLGGEHREQLIRVLVLHFPQDQGCGGQVHGVSSDCQAYKIMPGSSSPQPLMGWRSVATKPQATWVAMEGAFRGETRLNSSPAPCPVSSSWVCFISCLAQPLPRAWGAVSRASRNHTPGPHSTPRRPLTHTPSTSSTSTIWRWWRTNSVKNSS